MVKFRYLSQMEGPVFFKTTEDIYLWTQKSSSIQNWRIWSSRLYFKLYNIQSCIPGNCDQDFFYFYWSRQQAYRLKGKSREMITCWWTDSTHNWRQLLLPLEPTVAWTFGRDAVDEHLHLPTDIMGLQQKNTVVAVRHVKNRADT